MNKYNSAVEIMEKNLGGSKMLIKAVRLSGHPGIGDLSLNFSDSEEAPFQLIVIAGANGTGKSTLLGEIWSALTEPSPPRATVEIDLVLTPDEIAFLNAPGVLSSPPPVLEKGVLGRDATRSLAEPTNPFTYSRSGNSAAVAWVDSNGQRGVKFHNEPIMFSPPKALRRVLFSAASIEFGLAGHAQPHLATELDTFDELTRSDRGIGLAIATMLVELRRADNEDLQRWVQSHPGAVPPNEVKNRRLSRFELAFQELMPTKRFVGLSTASIGTPLPLFEEFGRIATIDQLSTGEKQIVFRGGHILRYQGALKDAVILIDEPELSLHPDWQKRIISFFKTISRQPDGSHPQIIIATHSPFIVHGAPDARVIILERDNATGEIREASQPTYPASAEAIAVEAFGLQEFVNKAKLAAHSVLLLTEGPTDASLITTAWAKRRSNTPFPAEIVACHGAKVLSFILRSDEFIEKLDDRAALGLFDFDPEGFAEWNGTFKGGTETGTESAGLIRHHASARARSMLLPVPQNRASIASRELGQRSVMPIELLFDDARLPTAMSEDIKFPGDIVIRTIRKGCKTKFSEEAEKFSSDDFAAFEPILQAIEALVR